MVLVKDYWTGWLQKGKRNPAVIAVANNLLKQVFADVKNECLFDRNYYKKIAGLICFYAHFLLGAALFFCCNNIN